MQPKAVLQRPRAEAVCPCAEIDNFFAQNAKALAQWCKRSILTATESERYKHSATARWDRIRVHRKKRALLDAAVYLDRN